LKIEKFQAEIRELEEKEKTTNEENIGIEITSSEDNEETED